MTGRFLSFIAALLWSWEMFPYSLECALNCPYFQPARIEQDLYTAINSFQYSSEVYKKLEGAKGYLYKRKLFLPDKLSLRPCLLVISLNIFKTSERQNRLIALLKKLQNSCIFLPKLSETGKPLCWCFGCPSEKGFFVFREEKCSSYCRGNFFLDFECYIPLFPLFPYYIYRKITGRFLARVVQDGMFLVVKYHIIRPPPACLGQPVK